MMFLYELSPKSLKKEQTNRIANISYYWSVNFHVTDRIYVSTFYIVNKIGPKSLP